MKKPKFVITDYLHSDLDWEKQQCNELGVDLEVYQMKDAPPEALINVSADADLILINMANFNSDVINGLNNCKLLMRHGIGYDNIDVKTCNEKGIAIAYYPDYCVKEVAEQTVLLIMACQRKLLHQVEKVKNVTEAGYPDYLSIAPIYRLHGKTIGIIGFGRIGSTVYQLMQGFGVKFLINDPYLSEKRKRKMGIETVSLDEVLADSDIVTLHVPYKKNETHYLINEEQLRKMKSTAILINTARGPIVNIDALNTALDDNAISLAGIDVYEVEPPSPDLPILSNNKVILTPHMSWMSVESGWEIRRSYIEDVRRFVNKQDAVHRVNPEVEIKFDEITMKVVV